MFDASQKSTGTGSATTVTFLIVAFILSQAVLVVFSPTGYMPSLAIACGMLSIALAWVSWKKYSQRSIPLIATQKAAVK